MHLHNQNAAEKGANAVADPGVVWTRSNTIDEAHRAFRKPSGQEKKA
ncbi:MAG: hypothetical protein LAP39_09440 [Acidobacteriia bacterium]|nr:hypothetical protein [Terriglobia bacterium]